MDALFGLWVYRDEATFYPALDAFLADGSNARFRSDLAFGDDGAIEVLWLATAAGWALETNETLNPLDWRGLPGRHQLSDDELYLIHTFEDPPPRLFLRWTNKNPPPE